MKYQCPCCGYRTFSSRYNFDTCYLCWWEDDSLGDKFPDEIIGGPNGDYSLNEARVNFKNNLIMFRKTDRRYKKLRNEKIDEIKRQIMVLLDKYEEINDEIEKGNLIIKINTYKNNLKEELKRHKDLIKEDTI